MSSRACSGGQIFAQGAARYRRCEKPEFVQLIEGDHFVLINAQIVSMTPQEVLDKFQQQ
jgi:hypothetical protein